jgi:uncharacterized protein with FMN-binding domain
MRTPDALAGRRNLAVVVATAATVGVLFLFPTSTNRGSTQRKPGQALAPVGVVTPSPGKIAATPGSTAATVVVVNGASVDTQYGPVQVQVKVRGTRVLSATAIDYPQGSGRDQEINSIAIPLLNDEAVKAQSAQIDTISGATYTSQGYQSSLQSALDAAHLQ